MEPAKRPPKPFRFRQGLEMFEKLTFGSIKIEIFPVLDIRMSGRDFNESFIAVILLTINFNKKARKFL